MYSYCLVMANLFMVHIMASCLSKRFDYVLARSQTSLTAHPRRRKIPNNFVSLLLAIRVSPWLESVCKSPRVVTAHHFPSKEYSLDFVRGASGIVIPVVLAAQSENLAKAWNSQRNVMIRVPSQVNRQGGGASFVLNYEKGDSKGFFQ